MGMKAVIFDIGRVLIDFDNMKVCGALTEFCDYSAEEIFTLLLGSGETQKTEGLEKLEMGLITPREFYQEVVAKINAPKLLYSDFFKIWGNIFSPNPDIDKPLARLKPNISTLVLSNTDWIRWRFLENLPVIRTFFSQSVQLVLSFKVHAKKPDPKIYQRGIRQSGIKPEEIIYIDDVPEYVAAFENFGVRGIVYNCQTDPIEVLESRLLELGALI